MVSRKEVRIATFDVMTHGIYSVQIRLRRTEYLVKGAMSIASAVDCSGSREGKSLLWVPNILKPERFNGEGR